MMIQELIVISFFCVSSIPFIISFRRGRFDIFEPIIWFSIFQLMVGFAFVERLYIDEPFLRHSEMISMDFKSAFLLISSLYLLFSLLLLIGYYIDISRFVTMKTLFPDQSAHNPDLIRRISYSYIFIGFIFYILLIFIALDGDVFRLFTTTEPRSELFAGTAALALGADLMIIGYYIWLVSKLVDGIKIRSRHLVPLLPLMTAFMLLGGRGKTIGILITTLMLVYYSVWLGTANIQNRGLSFPTDRLHYYARLAFVPLIGILAGFLVVLTRGLRQAEPIEKTIKELDIMRVLTAGIHNSEFDYLILLLENVPDKFGYYYGMFYARAFLNWIPRALWEDKPVLTIGSKLRRVVMPDAAGGRPPGIIGRYYVDFGYPGIFVGAFVTGILMRYIYELLGKNAHSPIFLLIYVTVLFGLTGGVANNTLFNIMSTGLMLIPILYLDYRNRSSRKI